jgi:hypothetical protein
MDAGLRIRAPVLGHVPLFSRTASISAIIAPLSAPIIHKKREGEILQYSVTVPKHPAPPEQNRPSGPSTSPSTSANRYLWSTTCNPPSASRRCIYASLRFISALGKKRISWMPSGEKMCVWKYSSSERPVTRSTSLPAQSMLTPYWNLVPGWFTSGSPSTSSGLPANSSKPTGSEKSRSRGSSKG